MADKLSINFSGTREASLLGVLLDNAFKRSLALETKLPPEILTMEGMSGQRYRMFINNLLGSLPNPRYLEIGSWAGSTACSAFYNNLAKVMCIDNWSQFGGPKDKFFANIEMYKSESVDFSFTESDFRSVDYRAIGKYNVYVFDGPHSYEDQYDATILALPALDREYIFIVDDWNWESVRRGTMEAIAANALDMVFTIEVRTTQDDTHAAIVQHHSDWHNGYLLAVVRH